MVLLSIVLSHTTWNTLVKFGPYHPSDFPFTVSLNNFACVWLNSCPVSPLTLKWKYFVIQNLGFLLSWNASTLFLMLYYQLYICPTMCFQNSSRIDLKSRLVPLSENDLSDHISETSRPRQSLLVCITGLLLHWRGSSSDNHCTTGSCYLSCCGTVFCWVTQCHLFLKAFPAMILMTGHQVVFSWCLSLQIVNLQKERGSL